MSQVDDIFDAMNSFSDLIHKKDKIRELTHKLLIQGERCGDCYNWMKTNLCPRECNVNGRNQGPTVGCLKCNRFIETEQSIEYRKELQEELNSLR